MAQMTGTSDLDSADSLHFKLLYYSVLFHRQKRFSKFHHYCCLLFIQQSQTILPSHVHYGQLVIFTLLICSSMLLLPLHTSLYHRPLRFFIFLCFFVSSILPFFVYLRIDIRLSETFSYLQILLSLHVQNPHFVTCSRNIFSVI